MSEQRPNLVRDLSLFDITMVGVGAMIGAGIFVLTGIAAGTAGPALILAFALNGLVTIFTAMVYAELGSAIPEAGGGYLWVKEGLPSWNAFLAGWMSWFAHAVAGSLYALGFGSYFLWMLHSLGISGIYGIPPEYLEKMLAVLIGISFVAINFKGVSETGTIGNVITIGKILILVLFIASGIWAIYGNPVYIEKLTPFAPKGMTGVLVAMGLTFIAFEGYEIIVQAGEEVKDPKKNVPKAIFLSLAIVIPIYMLVAFSALGAVNTGSAEPTWQWLGNHAELGLAQAATQFMPLGTVLLLVGGLFSTMSALNATTFSSTRVSFAMGRDSNLPDFFSKIHERTRTPYMALLMSGMLIIGMAVAVPIQDVAAAADVMFLILFLQVNIAIITIRRKYGDKLEYGYLMPFIPILPAINIGLLLFLAFFMFHFSSLAWFFVLGWIVTGFVIYFTYASKRQREKEVTPVVMEEKTHVLKKIFSVLVPVANPNTSEKLIKLGARIASPRDGEIVLLNVCTVAPQTPLRAASPYIKQARFLLDQSSQFAEGLGVNARSLVRLGHKPSTAIVDTVQENNIDFVIMGWQGEPGDEYKQIGSNIDDVIKYTRSNTLIAQKNVEIPADKIIVPVANPADMNMLYSIAYLMSSRNTDSGIDIINIVPENTDDAAISERREFIISKLKEPRFFDKNKSETSTLPSNVNIIVERSGDILHSIVSKTHEADLLILGVSQQNWLRRKVSGEKPYLIAHRSACPVIMVSSSTSKVAFSIQSFFQFFYDAGKKEKRDNNT